MGRRVYNKKEFRNDVFTAIDLANKVQTIKAKITAIKSELKKHTIEAMAKRYGISKQAVSKHLKMLEKNNFKIVRRKNTHPQMTNIRLESIDRKLLNQELKKLEKELEDIKLQKRQYSATNIANKYNLTPHYVGWVLSTYKIQPLDDTDRVQWLMKRLNINLEKIENAGLIKTYLDLSKNFPANVLVRLIKKTKSAVKKCKKEDSKMGCVIKTLKGHLKYYK